MTAELKLYEGSDGQYYTRCQILRRIRSGAWVLCLRERTDDRWLVDTDTNDLLALTCVSPSALPEWLEVRAGSEAAYVVDTRRSLP